MVKLKCSYCNHKWDYRGRAMVYATCSKCRRKVRLPLDEQAKRRKE